MLDISFQQLLLRGLALLVIAGFHGWAVAAISRLMGDPGPGYDGRMTLNPAAHLDWFGSAGFMLFQLGWIRPVSVDPVELRGGRFGLVAVALLALIATLVFAVLLLMLREPILRLVTDVAVGSYVAIFVRAAVDGAIWWVAINAIPFPPFTGGLVVAAIAPSAYMWLVARSRWIGAIVVAVASVGFVQQILGPLHDWLLTLPGFS